MAAGLVMKQLRKAGAFVGGELAAGQLGLDVTNGIWYFSRNGTTVEQVQSGSAVAGLNDLNDVTLTGPVADNEVLAYDTATSQYINQTAAEAGLAAASHTHIASNITDFQTEVANNASVAANTAARHTHSNKTTLDAITSAGSGAIITSAERTKLGTALVTADKGVANGVAGLDATGKVPVAQLPDTVLGSVEYQGTWNASTNSPNLGGLTPTKGDYYVVATAGATSLGGITDWKVGDWAIYNGTAWEKVDNTDAVSTVFGRTGTVTAQAGDYTATQITNTPAGNIAATTVQAALNELDSEKAPLSHVHSGADITTGDIASARMTTNLAAALNALAAATISNGSLTLDGGSI